MPDPASLRPRAYTVVNHDLEDDPAAEDKKLVLFVDAEGNIVHQCLGKDLPPVTPCLPLSPTIEDQPSPNTSLSVS